MFRRRLLRLFGFAQVLLCGVLLAALSEGHKAYRESVRAALQGMSETLLTACDTLKLVAESVQSREQIIQESVATLRSYRDLVLEVKRSAGQASSLVPTYTTTLDEVAATLKSTSGTMDGLAEKMDFNLPVITMEDVSILGKSFRIKPAITYARPLQEPAKQLQSTARRMDRLRETVSQTSVTMREQSKSMTLRVNEACDQSVRLLDEASRSLLTLKNEELRQAVKNLGAASEHLRGMSTHIREIERMAETAHFIGMLLSAALMVNALFMLLIPMPDTGTSLPEPKHA